MGKAEAPAGVCRDLRKSWKEGAEHVVGQERVCSLSSYTTLVGHPALPGPPFLHCQVKDLEALGISGLQAFASCHVALSPPLCRAVCSQRTEPNPRAVQDEPGPPDSLGIPTAPAGLRRSEIALQGGGWVAVVCRQH